MCQLNFINLNDEGLNKMYLWLQAYFNSFDDHKDGFGYFTKDYGIYRFMVPPSRCTNAGELISVNFSGNNPVISHVRKASISTRIPRDKNLVLENVHPFQTANFVLAHNGTLEFKDEKKMDEKRWKEKIDTKIFLERLEEVYLENKKKFVLSLKKTMDEFTGKFAFLIYEISTDKYYVVRGDTALLHQYEVKIDGKRIGFVVNTERNSLIRGMLCFANYAELNNIGHIEFDEKDIKILDRETIYVLDKRNGGFLKRLDDIKENRKPIKVYGTQREDNQSWQNNYKNSNAKRQMDDIQKRILLFLDEWDISIYYLNEMVMSIFNSSIFECDEEDLRVVASLVIPTIEAKCGKRDKNLKRVWKQMKEISPHFVDIRLHSEANIEFPYMLETDIRKMRDYVQGVRAKRSRAN